MAKKVLISGCIDRGRTYDVIANDNETGVNEMKKRTLEEDVDSALENIADGGGTVAEHAMLLARDHNLSFNEAVAILNEGMKDMEESSHDDDPPWGEQQGQVDWLESRYDSPMYGEDEDG